MGQTRRNFLKLAGAAGIGAAAAPRARGAAQGKARTVAARGNGNAGPKELPRNMTFCTLRRDGRYVLGVRTQRGVLDVEKAGKALRRPAPSTIEEVLQGTDAQALKALVDAAVANGTAKAAFVPEEQAPFGPCVTNPEKIMMLGYNYKKHVIETKRPMPDSPVLFNKYNNALNWHGGVINLPQKVAKKFDYEVELVVVMGKTARDVPKEKALEYVFGYCVGNDFSARDLQFKTPQLMLGKTSDGFGPIGPWLVTADQIPNVQKLGLQTRVNGELRQAPPHERRSQVCLGRSPPARGPALRRRKAQPRPGARLRAGEADAAGPGGEPPRAVRPRDPPGDGRAGIPRLHPAGIRLRRSELRLLRPRRP